MYKGQCNCSDNKLDPADNYGFMRTIFSHVGWQKLEHNH